MRSFKKYSDRGFTLIELMIVVAIVGVLSALAIYGVTKYLKSSKTAEVKTSVGQMAKDGSAAYTREKMSSDVLAVGTTAALSNSLCIGATDPVPKDPTAIQGKKYQPDSNKDKDYNKDQGAVWTGFFCLHFALTEPQYFQYNYTSDATASAAGTKFSAIGHGDLNADTKLSTFELLAELENGTVKIAPNFKETDPEE